MVEKPMRLPWYTKAWDFVSSSVRWRHRWFRLKWAIAWLFRSKKLGVIAAFITSAYSSTLSTWGTQLPWVKNHLILNYWLFIACLVLTLLVLIGKMFVDDILKKIELVASKWSADFVRTVATVVQEKTERHRRDFATLKPQADKFAAINGDPTVQLRLIEVEFANFLKRIFPLQEEQIDITIMERTSRDSTWAYKKPSLHETWHRTDPNELMRNNSAARIALETGHPVFIPDKLIGERKGQYHQTERDKDKPGGSVYVSALTFQQPDFCVEYIVSISTYGQRLCDDWEIQARTAVESYLREVCRRFELELALDAIRKV